MENSAAIDNITAGVVTGTQNKLKRRIRSIKWAIVGLSLGGVVFSAIGIAVLAVFSSKWNTSEKYTVIIGIVFLLIGLLTFLVLGIMIFIIVTIYNSMNNPGFHPLRPEQYQHLKYPRQQ